MPTSLVPRALLTALMIALGSGAAGAQPALAPLTTPPDRYQVADIHAYPWMQGRGTVGAADDLTAPDRVPFNLPIADDPAAAMLVVVHLVGPTWNSVRGTLVVEARAGRRRLARQRFRIERYLGVDGQLALPMIVAEVGCEVVTLSAKLTVPGTRAAATRAVRFGCGE
ncbi:MAG: hypothetical protein IPH44_27755 [Myxococcales bacterium]|nr:hypothetical protein [Myxococcales bacterium]MBK7196205.1 hypothetical protein [Myxococcales bacterium]